MCFYLYHVILTLCFPKHFITFIRYYNTIKLIVNIHIFNIISQKHIIGILFFFHSTRAMKPEQQYLPAQEYYKKPQSYSHLTRINTIQKQITHQCIEFLDLKRDTLVLDIGCGTGISGRELAEHGCEWIGCDISLDMLKENVEDEYSALGLFNLDIGDGLPFQPATFDAAISVSCIQWLFHNRSLQEARRHIRLFFTSLRSVLKMDGKAVCQFYSLHGDHTKILIEESKRAGFYSVIEMVGEGKHKKQYLTLDCSKPTKVKCTKKSTNLDFVKQKIAKMKEKRIKKGLDVSRDSKYSGRKRCKKFK